METMWQRSSRTVTVSAGVSVSVCTREGARECVCVSHSPIRLTCRSAAGHADLADHDHHGQRVEGVRIELEVREVGERRSKDVTSLESICLHEGAELLLNSYVTVSRYASKTLLILVKVCWIG